MSEPIPESIPTSADPRSKRPVKKRALTPVSKQAATVEALFARPDKEIQIPTGPTAKYLAPPPEIVANVQGSSAGAGSGEFHVYKASRRREYERVKLMGEETEKEKKDLEWEAKQAEIKRKDEEKRSKNQKRRQKKKEGAGKKKGGDGDKAATDEKKVVHNGAAPEEGEAEDKAGVKGGDASTAEEFGIVIHDDD
jgi:hypothetical protein